MESGYDGSGANPVTINTDYNIGQSGGMFIVYATYWKMAEVYMLS
jgi:hypothetical protein